MFAKFIWPGFKLLLSLALMAAILALFVAAPHALADPAMLGICAGLLFFAALPWVSFERPSRALGLCVLVFGIGVGVAAWHTAFGDRVWTQACGSRGRLFCETQNLLWLLGGPVLAALPMAAGAVALLGAGMRLLRPTFRRK